jgi:hypothetical protein
VLLLELTPLAFKNDMMVIAEQHAVEPCHPDGIIIPFLILPSMLNNCLSNSCLKAWYAKFFPKISLQFLAFAMQSFLTRGFIPTQPVISPPL